MEYLLWSIQKKKCLGNAVVTKHSNTDILNSFFPKYSEYICQVLLKSILLKSANERTSLSQANYEVCLSLKTLTSKKKTTANNKIISLFSNWFQLGRKYDEKVYNIHDQWRRRKRIIFFNNITKNVKDIMSSIYCSAIILKLIFIDTITVLINRFVRLKSQYREESKIKKNAHYTRHFCYEFWTSGKYTTTPILNSSKQI